jgi:FMNH2-dependent dimethyl sulfone monooxygenase
MSMIKAPLAGDDTMRIGLFYPHCATPHIHSEIVASELPDVLDMEAHRQLIQACEAGGLDFVFSYDTNWSSSPAADGSVSSRSVALMSPMLMMALAAMSSRIALVSTMHLGLLHPVMVARIGANIDALSGGRWALNIVAGPGGSDQLVEDPLRKPLGKDDHDARYVRASEAMEVIEKLWNGESVNHLGKFYRINGAMVRPLPIQRPHPALVSAGASPAGLALAARWADWHFMPGRMDAQDAAARHAELNQALHDAGRPEKKIRSLRHVSTLVRDTASEAIDATEALLAKVEITDYLRRYMSGAAGFSQTYDSIYQGYDQGEAALRRVGLSSGAIVNHGSPEQVAEGLRALYDEQQCRGVALTFPLWQPEEIQRFTDGVLPILERMGIWRSPIHHGWRW